MQIGYIDGPRLRRALVAACQWAQQQRSELNRINVFPVPDGDTGKLAELGQGPDEIVAELDRIRAQSGILFTVETFDRLLASGRVGRGRALLGVMAEDMGAEPDKVRFGIVHVGAPDIVSDVRERLIERYGEVEILSAPATPVISTHLGTGAWGVAYLVEDPAE